MLQVVFLWILSRGIELGVIVLCLLPFRWFLRKTAPRFFSYMMWSALPVNVIYNILIYFEPNISTLGVSILNKKITVGIGETILNNGLVLYGIGTIVVLCVMGYSYIRLQRCLVGCIRLRENIYETDRIKAPFSMGLFNPKIYLPYDMKDEYREPVVLHEQVHIKRKDLWMKYLAVAFLGVFWFQPVLWLAYMLFINDMESACDETVLRRSTFDMREVYATALVEVSYDAGNIWGAAIGYGSGELFDRVRNVMKFRKPGLSNYVKSGLLCVVVLIVALVVSKQIPLFVQREQRSYSFEENQLSVKTSIMSTEEMVTEE